MNQQNPWQLQDLSLFNSLTETQCSQLLDRHLERNYDPGQTCVLEQDWGKSVFLLRSGMAKVRTFSPDGDETVMAILGEGDVFGEMAALDGAPRSADIVALTTIKVLKLQATSFCSLLQQNADFALSLAKLEASRLRDLNRRFATQHADATTRILDALIYLARHSSRSNDPQALIPSLAQREIGVLAGMARETASRTLSKLRSKGIVESTEKGIRIAELEPLIKRGLLPGDSKRAVTHT